MRNASELQFEKELISYLTNIGGVKQWEYKKEIKTTQHLWDNFKLILEENNRGRLENSLSETEFNQIKKVINDLHTPFKAGQFLYGINGISEVEVMLDNGKRVFLNVFDQSNVGAGNTVYQVVNQVTRKKVIDGKQKRIFDVTLLINGLPIIQIELKRAMISTNDSFNQMKEYIEERQYGDIYSTIQVLVAMTPYDIKYMANTTAEQFNTDFSFDWQDEKTAKPIRDWKRFCDLVLSIPMAHDLTTRYMVLDGTKNKESLKVMRPYQVYATKRVLEAVSSYRFKYEDGKLGYIWHTTGSGKTITSFKTAWLASRLPNVDKVIFLVDRIALTSQTNDAYQAYDPMVSSSTVGGVVEDTSSVRDLKKKLRAKTNKNIIVTSIQKMSQLASRETFKHNNENIIFIVDEAHRSTGDGLDSTAMLEKIRLAIPNSGWIGYTGTPKFPDTKNVFGPLIHAYTIKEAIADRNVLGFKVEFKETIEAPENPSEEDIDDQIKGSVYDTSPEHVTQVVDDILTNWNSRSSNRRYNALFTVHVGGQRASSPRVFEYYNEFKRRNALLSEEDKIVVGASFSLVTNNSDYQSESNANLHNIIKDHNKRFKTNFGLDTIKEYNEDLTSRLNKTAHDGKYYDLVIVIDQLLTGFDAPQLNTLYIDRTLKNSSLIQAYSRTNRIHDYDKKPYGMIVNYRWPIQNEIAMNHAFSVYSNRDSAIEQQVLDVGSIDEKGENIESGIIAPDYIKVVGEIKELVDEIRTVTYDFSDIPNSETGRINFLDMLKKYSSTLTKIKLYPYDKLTQQGFPLHNLDLFYEEIGMTPDEEGIMNGVLGVEVKDILKSNNELDISHVELTMTHIREVIINYDYLVDLIAKMANSVNNKESDAVVIKNEILKEISKFENEKEKKRFTDFIENIFSGEFKFKSYPVTATVDNIDEAIQMDIKRSKYKIIKQFIADFGLENATTAEELFNLAEKHRGGTGELNKRNEVTEILYRANKDYKMLAIEEYATLGPIHYRNTLRAGINTLADTLKETNYDLVK